MEWKNIERECNSDFKDEEFLKLKIWYMVVDIGGKDVI